MGFVHDVLALVLPGALFNLVAHSARLRLRRVEGYALLFYTLLAGWLIQGATGLLNGLLLIAWEWIGFERMVFQADAYRAMTISGGMFFALIAAELVNRLWDLDRVSRDVAGESGEFRELTYQVAIMEQSPVEVTLETGKSYVGIPFASRVAMRDEGDLWLLLLMSGYRDKRQELRITTNYAAKLDEDNLDAAGKLPVDGFEVALPKSRIVSVRPFDVELYEEVPNVGHLDSPPRSPSAMRPGRCPARRRSGRICGQKALARHAAKAPSFGGLGTPSRRVTATSKHPANGAVH